jgi:hypothetical protein
MDEKEIDDLVEHEGRSIGCVRSANELYGA